MATLTISHTRKAGRRVESKAFLRTFAQRLRRRRELRELLSQPDYILKDIGVDRYEITREATRSFWLA